MNIEDWIPFFPYKLKADGKEFLIDNPVTGIQYEVNHDTKVLLRLCNGCRTFNEIIIELGRIYNINKNQIALESKKLLNILCNEGILWWRKQRMKSWHLPPPTLIFWNLTNKCNLSCCHCVVSAGKAHKEELNLDECTNLIDELADFSVETIMFSGGEPLMHRNFFEIAENAFNQGMNVQLATNATLITKQMAERLTDICVGAHVSLDGATPKVHNKIRQQSGSWRHTIQGIRNLIANNVPVSIATVVTKINIEQIPEIYFIAGELGVDSYRILPFIPFGRGRNIRDLEVSPKEMREIIGYLRQYREENKLQISTMPFECLYSPPSKKHINPDTQIGCDGARDQCTITSTGDVLPCNYFKGVVAENVKSHKFSWIWENSHFLNYFRSLTISDIRGACQSCAWLSLCRGYCIAVNYTHKNIFYGNYHCWIANDDIVSEESFLRDENSY